MQACFFGAAVCVECHMTYFGDCLVYYEDVLSFRAISVCHTVMNETRTRTGVPFFTLDVWTGTLTPDCLNSTPSLKSAIH